MTRAWAILCLALLAGAGPWAQQVRFSHPSGSYAEGFTLTLAASEGHTVRYTLDGTTPTAASSAYTSPLVLDRSALPASALFRVPTTFDSLWFVPDSVGRIVVVRAALFDSAGVRRSAVEGRTYIVASLLGRELSLPVLSLCADTASLFNFDTGIMVPGVHFDPVHPFQSGNYGQHGRDWERRAHLTLIEDGVVRLEQDCGVRVHGNKSRAYVQKGLTLYARAEYGNKRFRHPLFGPDGPASCKRVVLRPWSASWSSAGIEDWLCQQLAAPLACDHLATRPVVLFINGEYWGIFFAEEKPDEHYIEDHHGVDDEDVTLLSGWGGEVESGSGEDWDAFHTWLDGADLTTDADFGRVATMVDLDALTDYMLLQVFVSNIDWPANNVRQWAAPGRPWRWIFFDGDAALADWRPNAEVLGYLTCDDPAQSYPSSPRATLLFRRLLQRESFARHTVDRFTQLIRDHWNHDATAPLLQDITSRLADEVPWQSARFGLPATEDAWRTEVQLIDRYLGSRDTTMLADYAAHIGQEWFSLAPTLFPTLFPNPTTGAARLAIESSSRRTLGIGIFDIHGRQVWQAECPLQPGRNVVDLGPGLPPGLYLVRLAPDGTTLRQLVR